MSLAVTDKNYRVYLISYRETCSCWNCTYQVESLHISSTGTLVDLSIMFLYIKERKTEVVRKECWRIHWSYLISQITLHGSEQCFWLYPYIPIQRKTFWLPVGWVAAVMGVTDQVNRETGLRKGWSMPWLPLSPLPSRSHSISLHLTSISNDRGEARGGGVRLHHSGLVFHSALVVAPTPSF